MGMTLRNRKVTGRSDESTLEDIDRVKGSRPLTRKAKISYVEEVDGKNFTSAPRLRRAGSSISLSFSSSLSDNDEDDHQEPNTKVVFDDDSFTSDSKPRGYIVETVVTQIQGLYTNFSGNGLPWEGLQCRSIKAGLTGIFFALPALVCQQNRYEQAWWILQATTSVLADYFYIHTESAWHGTDRIVAQASLLGIVSRGSFYIQWWAVLMLVILPVFSFILADSAKQQKYVTRWHWAHFLWHILAPVACMTGVHLSYTCPQEGATELEFLKVACKAPF